MSRLHVSMPSLVHGVSQLSAAQRQPVHALANDNVWIPIDKGSQKRPPLIHVAKLQASVFGDCYCHGIDRGSGEQYMALFKYGATTANGLVFDTAGAVYVVKKNTGSYAAPDYATACDYPYLTVGSTPSQSIRALSVLDYTFVTTRRTAVTMANTLTTASPTNTAHLFIRQGNFALKYTVKIQNGTGTLYTFDANTDKAIQIPTAISAAQGFQVEDFDFPIVGGTALTSVKTQDIAERFLLVINGYVDANHITADGTNKATVGEFTCTRVGSVLKIVGNTGGGLPAANTGVITTFEVTTSQGDGYASGWINEADSINDLPEVYTHNYVLKIRGSNADADDDYYVKFTSDTAAATLSKGRWAECAKPAIEYTWPSTLSQATHPHALVRRKSSEAGTALNPVVGNGGKFFTFEPINLDSRLVGDTVSNPVPSFISRLGSVALGDITPGGAGGVSATFPVVRKVQDIAFFADRLVFACDESLSCSEQGNYFNFWRTTVRALPDSDPIDVSISGDRTTVYSHLVPFGGKLVLFADQVQSQFSGSPNVTPASVEASQVSSFQASSAAAPAAYKDGILYASIDGSYLTIRSLFPKVNVESNFDSDNLSIHIPSYIPGLPKQIEVNADSSVIAVLCDGDTDAIYILKQHREGDKIKQSAWVRFILEGATIRGIKFFGSKLYVVSDRTGGLYLEYIDLAAGVSDGGRSYWLHLDRRVTNPAVVFALGVSTITFPYDIDVSMTVEAVSTTGSSPLTRYGLDRVSATQYRFSGVDFTAFSFVAGIAYTSTHSFHRPEVAVNEDTGRRLILDSTSGVVGLWLKYADTSYFIVYTGSEFKEINQGSYGFLSTDVQNDSVFIGVGGRLDSHHSVSVQNNTPFPHTLVSGEWIVNVNVRSRAIQ